MSFFGRSLSAFALGALFAVAALCDSGAARAAACTVSSSVYQLSDQNSVACVNVASDGTVGMYDWFVDGVDQLSQQWFWYRVGSTGPELGIDTLGTPTVVSSANQLTIAYNGSAGASTFTVQVQYTLTGQASGTGQSHLHEAVDVTRTGGPPLTIYLYQYSNFDLGTGADHGSDDTVEFIPENRMLQYDPAAAYPFGFGGDPVDFAQTLATPPNYCEVGTVGTTLGKLNNTTANNLSNNCANPLTGDVTWAFEWTKTLSLTNPKLHIAEDQDLTVALPIAAARSNLAAVPEPAAGLLFGLGAFGMALVRRCMGRRRMLAAPACVKIGHE
jgi:hypothetical protein